MRKVLTCSSICRDNHQNHIFPEVWLIYRHTTSILHGPFDIVVCLLVLKIQESIFKNQYEEPNQNFYSDAIREWAHDDPAIFCRFESFSEPR